MSTSYVRHQPASRTRRNPRATAVSLLGPLTIVAGMLWALVQPYRITLLHPYGQGVWWLIAEPPLYAVIVGLAFYWFVAPGVVEDLEQAERERRG